MLSKFGLVPLATIGQDVRAFLENAAPMAAACRPTSAQAENTGVSLGLTIGLLALHGREKLTILGSQSIAAFGAWVEQLVAESTGKNRRGAIPIADESLSGVSAYGPDRLFVNLRDDGQPEPAQDEAIAALGRDGHPVVRIGISSPASIAQEFFRFEIATAVASGRRLPDARRARPADLTRTYRRRRRSGDSGYCRGDPARAGMTLSPLAASAAGTRGEA